MQWINMLEVPIKIVHAKQKLIQVLNLRIIKLMEKWNSKLRIRRKRKNKAYLQLCRIKEVWGNFESVWLDPTSEKKEMNIWQIKNKIKINWNTINHFISLNEKNEHF